MNSGIVSAPRRSGNSVPVSVVPINKRSPSRPTGVLPPGNDQPVSGIGARIPYQSSSQTSRTWRCFNASPPAWFRSIPLIASTTTSRATLRPM